MHGKDSVEGVEGCQEALGLSLDFGGEKLVPRFFSERLKLGI